ncbi:hypothetical protein N566_00315 [Streptomycetaceae bacterium MP113-05]|nr:hypothetical protein N566_00315 [Streptomycetaceae bacterium MP113-05]
MTHKPVAVGVDGSDPSIAALHGAAAAAARRGAALRIVYARPWRAGNQQFTIGLTAQEEWAHERLSTAWQDAARRHPDLTVTGEETSETPAKALLDTLREAQLLVLGSRGTGRMSGFLTGSVMLPVVARASGPVVLVRAGDAPAPAGDDPVVVGLDVEHRTAPVAEFAFAEADRTLRPLVAVSVWSLQGIYAYPSALPDPRVGTDLEARAARALENALAPWLAAYPDVKAERLTTAGAVAPRLLQAAAEASLVVVGRRRHKHLASGTPLGPVTHAVLHHAAAPVAVVPHD